MYGQVVCSSATPPRIGQPARFNGCPWPPGRDGEDRTRSSRLDLCIYPPVLSIEVDGVGSLVVDVVDNGSGFGHLQIRHLTAAGINKERLHETAVTNLYS